MVKKREQNFKSEFKRSLSTAIIAAFSLLAALSWSDVIRDYLGKLESVSIFQGKIILSTIVTLLAALAVYVASKINKK
ncbi:MAG: DUF5654 family protein [Nanoarchaeota archaeon]|nr:DUF5654 family protein [Nanoarchaeota archaeon]